MLLKVHNERCKRFQYKYFATRDLQCLIDSEDMYVLDVTVNIYKHIIKYICIYIHIVILQILNCRLLMNVDELELRCNNSKICI